jgi:2-polyprenyl-3-methyl-5-hydroxy-6-metoxy-1,4-benzoquinol methylase
MSDVAICIDCGSQGVIASWVEDGSVAICTSPSCGLAFLSTWPTELAGGATFHEGNVDYYERMVADERRTALEDLNLSRIRDLLTRLERFVPGSSLLDVGCGRGEAVYAASALGWRATGIDLAPGAIRIAQAHGLDCRKVDFFSSELDDRRFGLVFMSEFLEHVPETSSFLRRARQLLLPGGVLYVTTPNVRSLGRRVLGTDWSAFIPGHVVFFDRHTLARKAQQAGFNVVETRTAGVSVTAMRRLVHRSTSAAVDDQYGATQSLREAIYASAWKRRLKAVVDPVIGASGLGETLKMVLVANGARGE